MNFKCDMCGHEYDTAGACTECWEVKLDQKLIDTLQPTHQRSSCSDEDPNNYMHEFDSHWRCVRCELLYRLRDTYISSRLFDIIAQESFASPSTLLRYQHNPDEG